MSLIKPQFEAGRGVCWEKRDRARSKSAPDGVGTVSGACRSCDFSVLDLTYSPITGQEGNIEYLGFLEKGAGRGRRLDLQAVIDASHRAFRGEG